MFKEAILGNYHMAEGTEQTQDKSVLISCLGHGSLVHATLLDELQSVRPSTYSRRQLHWGCADVRNSAEHS